MAESWPGVRGEFELSSDSIRSAKVVEGFSARCEDRAEVFARGSAVVCVVADGAGGPGRGGRSAERVVEKVAQAVEAGRGLLDPRFWRHLLEQADAELAGEGEAGETTAVVAACTPLLVVGASVGDSGCWLLEGQAAEHLTKEQLRKPLLGSGEAVILGFSRARPAGTLLAASDGLLKYAPMERIRPVALTGEVEFAAAALVELVRLRSRALQDDVAVVLCRIGSAAGSGDVV